MKILIDGEKKKNIAEWNKYKYLLDLPGAYPWSVRFKELLATNSVTIKVDTDKPWINFYSDIFIPGKDYIQVKYVNSTNKAEKITNASKTYENIYRKIKYLSDKKYKKIVHSSSSKIKFLNTKLIVFYLENLITKYLKHFC